MRSSRLAPIVTGLVAAAAPAAQDAGAAGNDPLPFPVLWDRAPARSARDAYPIGNGAIAARVRGDPAHERIALNVVDAWRLPRWPDREADEGAALRQARELIRRGDLAAAERLMEAAMVEPTAQLGWLEPIGEIGIDLEIEGEVAEYRRELDLRDGIARARWRQGIATYSCEAFVSAPDHLLVVRLRGERGSFSARVSARCPSARETELREPGHLVVRGSVAAPEEFPIFFEGQVVTRLVGGRLEREAGAGDGAIVARDVFALVLLCPIETGLAPGIPAMGCAAWNERSAPRSFDELLERHVADRRGLMDRVGIELGDPGAAATRRELPTRERIARFERGEPDPDLVATQVQLARHLLLCGSRGFPFPAPSGGPWCEASDRKDARRYATDGPLQMAAWPAEPWNLSECHEPLLDFVGALVREGRKLAKERYGARGFALHGRSDLLEQLGSQRVEDAWPMGGAWLALHLHERWEFARDDAELRDRVWPVLKEAALFLLDWLVEGPDGTLVTMPSQSPGRSFLREGVEHRFTWGSTIDLAIARELLARALAAAERLDVDSPLRVELRHALARLHPIEASLKTGRLKEWAADYEPAEVFAPGSIRAAIWHGWHLSPLFAVFPGTAITPRGTPLLAAAARAELQAREAQPGEATDPGRAWRACVWARLEDGARAEASLRELISSSPFGPEPSNDPWRWAADLAGAAAVAEMLVQSHAGELSLLPALPPSWDRGVVTGLRARCGLEVDLAWSRGELDRARLVARTTGPIRLRARTRVTVRGASSPIYATRTAADLLVFDAAAGAEIEVVPAPD